MTVNQNMSDNRPPPRRRRSFNLLTSGIPWYRDIKVIRVLAQVLFFVLFVGGLQLLFSNLATNLNASNLALDWQVYRRPFNVAISEGPSLTEPWTWVEDTTGLGWSIYLALVAGVAFFGFRAVQQYRTGEFGVVGALIPLILLALVVTSTPEQIAVSITDFMNTYFYPSSMARAFYTGLVNTLTVVALSLVACTVMGILVGIGLLSSNFLLRNVSTVFVEIFRNTPLVVQLIFVYRTLTLLLPAPRQSIFGPDSIGSLDLEGHLYILNARGFYFVKPEPTESNLILWGALLVGLIVAWGVRRWRNRVQDATGAPARAWTYTMLVMLLALVVGWLLAGTPYTLNYPALVGPNVREGSQLTIGFVALFLGLTLYTAAFIADIVRAGIQSVEYGQIEAARSMGLRGGQVLSLVVLPQALRLIIPPLGNQYVNLGKNSSLGLVVSYADTYRIAQIANNESGQAVPFFVGLMVIYLGLSLILSLMTNLVNRGTRIKTR